MRTDGRRYRLIGLWAGFLMITIGSFTGLIDLAGSQPVPVPEQVLSMPVQPHQSDSNPTEHNRIEPLSPLIQSTALKPVAIQAASIVKQGEVLKVGITSLSQFPHQTASLGWVTLANQKAALFSQPNGSLLALVPVSVFQKPGVYSLNVYAPGEVLLHTSKITIQDGQYRTQNVTVSKTTAGLQPLPGELEAIQALKDTVSNVKYWSEPFMSPTIDCQNSPFGVKRLHNGTPTGNYHKGLDLRSPAGRPIHAISGGKVQIARMYRLHGGTVGLDHGQGVGSIYIHMSRLNVKPGTIVKKGDVIGFVGSTGFASGPHLHWGMYVSGLPVNPNQWISNVRKCN